MGGYCEISLASQHVKSRNHETAGEPAEKSLQGRVRYANPRTSQKCIFSQEYDSKRTNGTGLKK